MTAATNGDPYPDAFILLTGGAGRRLGGVDKAALKIGGQSLLNRAVARAAGRPVVVVGPDPPVGLPVIVTREDPPGGGPAAGVSAGVAALLDRRPDAAAEELTAVLAIDQIGVTPATWRRLATAARAAASGAILIDGRSRQYGVGVFPLALLRRACDAQPTWHSRPLRALLDPIVTVEVPARDDESRDIDTLEDLSWWRAQTDAPPATDEPVDEGTP
jgi:molybdopterin-guanine dinucleotide biosynthesis protein A